MGLSNWIDAFFEGMKKNATNRVLNEAKKARVSKEAIAKMEEIERNKKELEEILSKIPIPKNINKIN